jgi:hypothetical protein
MTVVFYAVSSRVQDRLFYDPCHRSGAFASSGQDLAERGTFEVFPDDGAVAKDRTFTEHHGIVDCVKVLRRQGGMLS